MTDTHARRVGGGSQPSLRFVIAPAIPADSATAIAVDLMRCHVSVTMICPNLKCGRTVVAPDNLRGKVVRCVHCETAFMVPKLNTEQQRQNVPSEAGEKTKS